MLRKLWKKTGAVLGRIKRLGTGGILLLLLLLIWPFLPGGSRSIDKASPRNTYRPATAPLPKKAKPGPTEINTMQRNQSRLVGCLGKGLEKLPFTLVAGGEPYSGQTTRGGWFMPATELPKSITSWWTLDTCSVDGVPISLLIRGDCGPKTMKVCPESAHISGLLLTRQHPPDKCRITAYTLPEAEFTATTTADKKGNWSLLLPLRIATDNLGIAVTTDSQLLGTWTFPPGPKGRLVLPVTHKPCTVSIQSNTTLPPGTTITALPIFGDTPVETEIPCPGPGAHQLNLTPGTRHLLLTAPYEVILGHALKTGPGPVTIKTVPRRSSTIRGRVFGAKKTPLAGAQIIMLPEELLAPGGLLPAMENWPPGLATKLRQRTETDSNGCFTLVATGLKRASLSLRHPTNNLIRYHSLELPQEKVVNFHFRPPCSLVLSSLASFESAKRILTGKMNWWLLDTHKRIYAQGQLKSVPEPLCEVETGDYKLLLCHQKGACAFLSFSVEGNRTINLKAFLAPPRNLKVIFKQAPLTMTWLGPGNVPLLRRLLTIPGKTTAPAQAVKVSYTIGNHPARTRILPHGVPPVLSFTHK